MIAPLSIERPAHGDRFSPTSELLHAGVPADDIAFSVDVTCQTNANPFEMMRIVLGTARSKAGDAKRLSPRQVLRIGTIGGAGVLGLEKETGSLTPGKRADLVMLRTSDINMIPPILQKMNAVTRLRLPTSLWSTEANQPHTVCGRSHSDSR